MCFSATASFAAGAALTAVGAATMLRAKKSHQKPFAAIPLFFGIQQIAEGFVWLSLAPGGVVFNTIPIYLYFFFAHAWWPAYLPFAVLSLETDAFRKRLILLVQIAGLIVGAYYAYYLVTSAISARIFNSSIIYSYPWDTYSPYMVAAYILAACGSCLLSSSRIIQIFGILTLTFLIVAVMFFYAAFVSVWCFFAAILSLIVYLYVSRR
ncbi:hypothetical protein FJY93_03870 [Candidatus Kaiserbacteria bacterium]|nr:hypothetical protein [Candidatus Kaiserbacteria bacterium]